MAQRHGHQRILVGFRLVAVLGDVLRGMTTYVRQRRVPWHILCVDVDRFAGLLAPATADGAISVVPSTSTRQLRRIARSGVPTVNMLQDASAVVPSVLSDDVEIGRVAAREFLQRGFQQFAFAGLDLSWCKQRYDGFSEVLRSAGHACEPCAALASLKNFEAIETRAVSRSLAEWVTALPKPVAVLAASDTVGALLLEVCTSAGVNVPDSVAVLGVDNIVHTCELADVPMSSVAQNFERMGFEAAAVLDGLMAGRPPDRPVVLVPPGPVVSRRSTDVLAFDDPDVTAAMRLIHDHAATGIGMGELLARVPVSRRWLDDRFKALVGHPVSGEIRKQRLAHLRDMLLYSDLSIKQIALRSGFARSQNMVRFFRDAFDMPPNAYRLEHKAGGQRRDP